MSDVKTDIMIIGAQKSATTSLFEMLRRTDRIVGASPKEPQFFSQAKDWRRELPEYERIYTPREGALYCEASTTYTFYPHRNLGIWNDIYQYNPAMKLIYIVRNPLDRIVSHYKHSFRRGMAKGSIRDFVVRNPLPLAISRYHAQVVPYIRTFGQGQVLIVQFDDVVSGDPATLGRLASFLCLEEGVLKPVHVGESGGIQRRNRLVRVGAAIHPRLGRSLAHRITPQPTQTQMSRPLKEAIVNVLETDIAALERLIDTDLSAWRKVD